MTAPIVVTLSPLVEIGWGRFRSEFRVVVGSDCDQHVHIILYPVVSDAGAQLLAYWDNLKRVLR